MRWHIAIYGCCLFLLSHPAFSDCERRFSMSHSGDYVPYQYTNAKSQLVGLDVDIASHIVSTLGCQLSLEKLPPKRAQHLLKEGALDIMAAASITSERHQYAHFSLPYRDESIALFVRKNQAALYNNLTLTKAMAKELKMGAGLGGWYGIEYQAIKEQAITEGLLMLQNSTEQRIKMLTHKLLDVVIADLYVGYYHGKKYQNVAKIVDLPHKLNNDPVHFMLSRKTFGGAEVDAFNQALVTFMASDQYSKLILKYRPEK